MQKVYRLLIIAAAAIMAAGCFKDPNVGVDKASDAEKLDLTAEEVDVLAKFMRGSTQVSLDEAMLSAMNVFGTLDKTRSSVPVTETTFLTMGREADYSVELGYQLPDTIAYVFNFGRNGGFAIVAADSRVDQSVLAFVYSGSFGGNTADNPGMALFMELARNYVKRSIHESELKRAELMPSIQAKLGPGKVITRTGGFNYDTMVVSTGGPAEIMAQITPMLPVEWDQSGSPWNDSVKYGRNNDLTTAPAGCTAVAVAHIMAYWQHPASITVDDFTYDFDWDEMNQFTGFYSRSRAYKNWTYYNANADFDYYPNIPVSITSQVASLMKAIGYRVNMTYTNGVSSASLSDCYALLKNFGYTGVGGVPGKYGVDYDYDVIKTSLDDGKPLMIEGYTGERWDPFYGGVRGDGIGHAWNIDGYLEQREPVQQVITVVDSQTGEVVNVYTTDGYKESRWLHNNWGGGGSWNGYFAESCFDYHETKLPSTRALDYGYAVRIYANLTPPAVRDNMVHIPDSYFRTYLRDVHRIQIDAGGYTTKAQVKNITKIDFARYPFATSLEGVQHFENLTELNCSACTRLQNLDLTGLKKLKILYCLGDFLITSLDLSANTALEFVHCPGNKITSLNVRNLVNLKSLNCNTNQITSLDLSTNTALEELDCGYTRIADLDLSSLVNLKVLKCVSSNYIRTVDLSNNIKLKIANFNYNYLNSLNVANNVELEELNCSNGRNITSLTLGNNSALTNLECYSIPGLTSLNVGGLPNLQRLNCSYTGLTSLDISHNTNLINLACMDCNMSSLDVSNNVYLLGLSVGSNNVTFSNSNKSKITGLRFEGSSMQAFTLNLSGFSELNNLVCYNCPVTSLDLTGCTKLASLSCQSTMLASLNLVGYPQLYFLDCSGNSQLASLNVSGCTSLPVLYCRDNPELFIVDVTGCPNLYSLNASNTPSLQTIYTQHDIYYLYKGDHTQVVMVP